MKTVIFLSLLVIIFVSACVQPSLTVSDITERKSELLNQNISVEGIAGIGILRCTLMACMEDNPCCNSCGGSLLLKDKDASIEIRGLGAGCGGNECSQTCKPLEQGKKYAVTGVLKESYGELYVELKDFTGVS